MLIRVTRFRYGTLPQWYPVAILKFTAQDRPQPFTLLGRDIVLWNDGTAWRAFEDKVGVPMHSCPAFLCASSHNSVPLQPQCPHRLAPLSEGRIEKDGTLLCAYHAWRFDGSGNCTSIPQARALPFRPSANPQARPPAPPPTR